MSRIAPALLVALGVWICGGDSAQADGGKKGSYPAAASSQWSGFYVGAGIGSAWGDATFDFQAVPPPPLSMDLDSTIAGGIFVGYQRQWGQIVGGIEAGALFTNAGGSTTCVPGILFTCTVDVDWVLMIGPRLGMASNNFHFYGTGGLAIGSLESRTVTTATGVVFDTGDGQHTGWYLGGGVEWNLTRAWVLGLEYRHIELGSDSHASVPGSARDVEATLNTLQARLTLKLGD